LLINWEILYVTYSFSRYLYAHYMNGMVHYCIGSFSVRRIYDIQESLQKDTKIFSYMVCVFYLLKFTQPYSVSVLHDRLCCHNPFPASWNLPLFGIGNSKMNPLIPILFVQGELYASVRTDDCFWSLGTWSNYFLSMLNNS
jgi:hypothetical protein